MNIFPSKPQFKQIDPVIFNDINIVCLDNGIPVYMINAGTEDILRVEFIFSAGYINESQPLLASSTNLMLTEGSQQHSAATINKLLDYYGTYHSLYTERDKAGLVLYFMNRYSEKVLELAKEILFKPLFPEHELKSMMNKRLRWFIINREKVQNLANDRFYELIFGDNHPYGKKINESDFEKLNVSLLKKFHNAFYNADSMAIIVSGNIRSDTLFQLNKTFNTEIIPKKHIVEKRLPVKSMDEKQTHIKKKDAVQTAIRIGSTTINKRNSDYPGLKIADTILGGYFGSRLMKNIREEKGLTYGIYSMVSSLNLTGYKMISAEVSKKFTQNAIDEIYKEIYELQAHPVSFSELEVVRNYMLGEMIRMFDGPFALAEAFRSVWEFGLDNNYYKNMISTIKTISPDEIMHLAKTYYKTDELFQVTAG